MMGAIGTGQPQLNYPHLHFEPQILFSLGSPIGNAKDFDCQYFLL